MTNEEKLSAHIGGIYDAALDDSLWPQALAGVTEFVGGAGAGLFGRDSARKSANAYYGVGVSDEWRRLYFGKYRDFDPLATAYFCIDVGDVVSNSQIVPQAEFIETRFYREWVKPQGFVDNVVTVLEKASTSITALAVFRHERDGFTDDAARHRLRLLVPHLRRAVLIGKVIETKTEQAASLADTLDGVSAALYLVDSHGHVVHANAAGLDMLTDGSVLNGIGGKLGTTDASSEAALHDALINAGMGDAALGVKGIAVPLATKDGDRYVAHVLPLTSGQRVDAGRTYRAAAAVFVHKAKLDIPSPPEAIAKSYRLTPTELRVLLAIVQIGGVPEAAEALGIGETTVKTHLGRLYEKTGARRQADLVKLVAGFASPLA